MYPDLRFGGSTVSGQFGTDCSTIVSCEAIVFLDCPDDDRYLACCVGSSLCPGRVCGVCLRTRLRAGRWRLRPEGKQGRPHCSAIVTCGWGFRLRLHMNPEWVQRREGGLAAFRWFTNGVE